MPSRASLRVGRSQLCGIPRRRPFGSRAMAPTLLAAAETTLTHDRSRHLTQAKRLLRFERIIGMELVRPAAEHLASYRAALEQSWSFATTDPDAGRLELQFIDADPAAFRFACLIKQV